MGSDISSEPFLGSQVEIDHSVVERFGVHAKIGYDFEKSPVGCTVDLLEKQFSRVVGHDQRGVTKETVTERYTIRVGGGL